ncbi:MAG TPA: FAD:protein FMN transferase [Pseudonocardiaceae bacterium]|nr:FAD:protein FMN transferase [Pseudonocardiaceae bacterium]
MLSCRSLTSGDVATSGSARRGRAHHRPRTGRPASGLVSVTQWPSLTCADVLATAAFARDCSSVRTAPQR